MKRNGFTLIELLAVILILGIIALIAIPSVNALVNQAKDKANIRNVETHIKDVNTVLSIELLNGNIKKDSAYSFDELTTNDYPQEDKIRCSYYVVEGNNIVKALNCDIDDKNYCFDNEEVKECTDSDKPASFETDSWGTIVSNIRNGKGYLYAPNDKGVNNQIYKEIDLGELGIHKLRVINTTPCKNNETSETACGFVVEFADDIAGASFYRNPEYSGGYPNSNIYPYMETIYNAMPEELQNIILNTTVVSGHDSTENETNYVQTNQKLYLLSLAEVFGDVYTVKNVDTAFNTTRQLDYYKLNTALTDRKKTTDEWWTRTPDSNNTKHVMAVVKYNTRGYVSHHYINPLGISPAFRIG